jgi:PAS domain S-box-containing protein
LYDEVENILRFSYFKDGEDEPFMGGIQPGKGLTAYVLRTGKALLCTQDVHDELERQGEVKLLGVPSAIWLGVPLIVDGKTIGAMVVQHYTDPQAYGERELHMLEFVSSQVAIAITRKQAEEALRASEARYHGLFEHSPISLWEEDFSEVKRHIENIRQSGVTDFHAFFESHPQELLKCISEIKVLDVNAATLTLMHAANKDQLTQNLQQVYPADTSAGFVDEFVSIAEGQIEFAWESPNYTLDGQKLTFSLQRSAEPGYEDTLEKVLISVRDITARKQADEALRESEEKYRKLFNNSEVGMFRTRLDGSEILEFNEKYLKILGYTFDEIAGKPSLDIWADQRERDRMVQMLNSQGEVNDFECVALTKLGEPRTCITSLRLYPDQGILEGSILDITERKRTEEEITTILRTTIEGYYLADQDGRILDTNESYCAMIGYSRAELLEMQVEEIEAVDSPEEIKKRIEQIKQTGSARFETRHKRKDGKIIDIEANVNILFQDQPKICCFMRDITDRKQVEDQIRQLNASLEERVAERTRQLSEAQEQLVRNEKLATLGQLAGGVGHELRNPLGVINSAVYYLKLVQPDADENIKKYHGIIEQEVNTASRIINDLLDFGRIVSPDRQLVSIPDLLQHMLTRFPVPPAVHLQLALPASLPKVFVDPIQLEQVLGNLTTNACQAMRECKDGGSLVISASRKKDQVAISVKDTGTGITPAALQRMFEPLFTTKLRGIGLGLAVSKKLTEANGGSITVRSQPGEGATFTVTLPVKT